MTLGATRVIWTINDLSMFVDEIVRGYVFMCVEMQRGRMHEPVVISSMEEYRRVCGLKHTRSTDPLVVEMGLRQGARFILSRLGHYTDIHDAATLAALKAFVTVNDRGASPLPAIVTGAVGPYTFRPAVSGRITATEVAPYTFGAGTSNAFKVKVGTAGTSQQFTLSGSMQTAQQVCDQINAATNDLTAEIVDGRPRVRANNAADLIEIQTVANDAYSVLGFVEAVYAADSGTNKLIVAVNRGADQTFTLQPVNGEAASFMLTAAQVVLQLAALASASASVVNGALRLTTVATGPTAYIQVKATSTAAAAIGLNTTEHAGASGSAQPTLKFWADNPGEWGNYLIVQISDSALNPDQLFNVKIVYGLQGELQENYVDVSMDPSHARYAVNYIKERSLLISVEDLESPNLAPSNRPAVNLNGVPLAGGDDGGALVEHDYIGDPTLQTGMYAADKNWNLAMDLMIPGTTSPTVYQAMITYVESRQDMIAHGQVPFGMTPEEVVDWRLGNLPWSHPAFNSHRFCLWFGYPKVYDDMDDTRKFIPNLGHLASCLCKTDNNYGQWYAPVGPKRGVVTLVEDIDFNIQSYRSTGYADLFAENGVNYLFISHIPGIEGAMFWEQRTTQRAASALRELNVVRFITMMNRALLPVLRMFLDDPNHPVTWREIHRVLQPAFQDWKDRYAIYDFALQTDRDAYFDGGVLRNAVLNSGLDIDRGIYHCRALIQPTRTIYYLEITLGVMRTGEAFADYMEMKTLPGWVRA